MTTLVVSLRNLTLPSPKRQLAPPGWKQKISSLAPALLPRGGRRWSGQGDASFIGRNLLLIWPETPKAASASAQRQ